RIAVVGSVAAAALALGVGSAVVLSDRTGDDRSLPATTSSVTGESVMLELGSDPLSDSGEPLVAVVTTDEDQKRLGFTLQTEDGAVLRSRETAQPREEQALWVRPLPGITVASLPATATSALPLWTSTDVTPQVSVSAPSPDGRVLVVWRASGSPDSAFSGITWTDGETAFTAQGQALDSVAQDDVVFFVGGSEGYVGYLLAPDGSDALGSGEVKAAGDMEPGHFPAVWLDDASGSSGTYATYLPPVEDVELVVTGDARIRDLTLHDFGDVVGVLAVADIDGPRESVTHVRFTDPVLGDVGGPAPAD
ncbi:MAG: hypothetical protein WBL35_16720, partial [Ornithinibacter sp.]